MLVGLIKKLPSELMLLKIISREEKVSFYVKLQWTSTTKKLAVSKPGSNLEMFFSIFKNLACKETFVIIKSNPRTIGFLTAKVY